LTLEFAQAVEQLLEITQRTADPSTPAANGRPPTLGMTNVECSGNTAIMCAERVYFQCHRMLVSDYLTAHGHNVLHIDDGKHSPGQHKLMTEARLVKDKLVYDAQQLF